MRALKENKEKDQRKRKRRVKPKSKLISKAFRKSKMSLSIFFKLSNISVYDTTKICKKTYLKCMLCLTDITNGLFRFWELNILK